MITAIAAFCISAADPPVLDGGEGMYLESANCIHVFFFLGGIKRKMGCVFLILEEQRNPNMAKLCRISLTFAKL